MEGLLSTGPTPSSLKEDPFKYSSYYALFRGESDMYKELVRQAMSRLYFYLLPTLLFILAVVGHFTMVYLHVEVRFHLRKATLTP